MLEGYCLKHWEEALGVLQDVQKLNGYVLAKIGPVTIVLPDEIGYRLTSFVGQRISVLRTENDYRFKVISTTKSPVETGSESLSIAQDAL